MADNSANLEESLSEDFALSDSSVGQGLISDLPSDIDEPTHEEIEEWAKVDSPAAVRSVNSSQSDKDMTEHSAFANIADTIAEDSSPPPGTTPPRDAVLNEAKNLAAQLASADKAENARAGSTALKSPVSEISEEPKSQKSRSADHEEHADASGSGWGWNSGWGWDKIRQVAAEAVRDVSELKESFQQVIKEVVEAESDEEDPETTPLNRTASPAAPEPEPEVQRKHQILERLEGPDTQLEVGLKAIDDQVEQLATGAAKALGSIWGGLAGVAKGTITAGQSLVGKVESATMELAKELVLSVEEGVKDVNSGLKGVSELGTNLATRAEKGLETMGRTAIGLLEEVAGPGHQQGLFGSRDADGSTFDQCFYTYGGRRSYEELEALANECAQLCNRTRAKLDADGKAMVDSTLTELTPLFDLLAAAPPPTASSATTSTEATAAGSSATDATLGDTQTQSTADEGTKSEGADADGAKTETKAGDGSTTPQDSSEGKRGGASAPAEPQSGKGVGVEVQLQREYQPVAELHEAGLASMRKLLQWAEEEAEAAVVRLQQQEKEKAGDGAGPSSSTASNGAGSSNIPVATPAAPPEAPPKEPPKASAASSGDGGDKGEGEGEGKAGGTGAEEGAMPAKDSTDAGASSTGAGTVGTSPGAATSAGTSTSLPGGGRAQQAAVGEKIVDVVRREGMRRLAELCATEVQLLLRLGRSIAAPARYGRRADDGIQWPTAAVGKATLLHQTAQRMSADIEAAAEEFLTALNSVGEVVAAKLLDERAAQSAEMAGSDLEVDCGTAAARIQEGFRNLMYVVLLSSLHSEGVLKGFRKE